MGDRVTSYEDCPKCGGKGVFECYEALSSNMKFDECTVCDYHVSYDITEADGVINFTAHPSEPLSLRELAHDHSNNGVRERLILLFYGEDALQEYQADNSLAPITVHQALNLIESAVRSAIPEKKQGTDIGTAYVDCGGTNLECSSICEGHPVQRKDSYSNGYNQAITDMEANLAKLIGKEEI